MGDGAGGSTRTPGAAERGQISRGETIGTRERLRPN
jgi:hypothetical protein